MPSKEKQWSALGEATSHVERLSTLKPRKLVNDFTKMLVFVPTRHISHFHEK
jgi:hypothetical protein